MWTGYQRDGFACVSLCVRQEETRGSRKLIQGRLAAQGQLLEGATTCEVHVCRSVCQQLLWGCVPWGLHVQVPPHVQMESPATEQSMDLRPGSENSDTMYVFIAFH